MKSVWVEILNFKKYNNPRKGIKSTSWYRMQNDFITNPDFFDLDNAQRLLWPYLLGEASHKMHPAVRINFSLAAALLKGTAEQMSEALEYFASLNMLRLHETEPVIEVATTVDDESNDECSEDHTPNDDSRDVFVEDARHARDATTTCSSKLRDVFVEDARHNGTERNDNENTNTTPLTPLAGGGALRDVSISRSPPDAPSKREIRERADDACVDISAALRAPYADQEAFEDAFVRLEPFARELLRLVSPRGPDALYRRARDALAQGSAEPFWAGLRKDFRAKAGKAYAAALATEQPGFIPATLEGTA